MPVRDEVTSGPASMWHDDPQTATKGSSANLNLAAVREQVDRRRGERIYPVAALVVLAILSLGIRAWVAERNDVSRLSQVAVSASHLDLALGIIQGEPFSFNLDRHVWIEEHLDSLLDRPVASVPNFANAPRIPVAYMDPGYGVIIGHVFKALGRPIDFVAVRRAQIVLDVALLTIVYLLGRQIGLSGVVALIPVAVHAGNVALMRPVFQIVQDFSVVFLVLASLALVLARPSRVGLKVAQYLVLFACGGLLLWVRSLFVLFPLSLFVSVAMLGVWKPAMRRLRWTTAVFFAGGLCLFWGPRNLQFSNDGLPFSFGRPGCFWYSFYCGLHQFDAGPTGDALALRTVYMMAPELKIEPLVSSWTKIDAMLKPVVLGEIRASPGHYLAMSARRFGEALFPSFYGNYDNSVRIPGAVILVARVVLFVICAWILVFAVRQTLSPEDTPALILLLPWFYIAAVSAPFFLQGRSLMPAIDGLVIVFAAAVSHTVAKLRAESARMRS